MLESTEAKNSYGGGVLQSLTLENDLKVKCSRCGSVNVSRSRRHGTLEKFLKLVRVLPCRCNECDNRFFRFRPDIPAQRNKHYLKAAD